MYIATNVIVVYIPQLTTPDPRSIVKSLRMRAYQVRDLLTIHNRSGISPQVTKTPANWGVMQPEVVPRQLLLRLISQEPLI